MTDLIRRLRVNAARERSLATDVDLGRHLISSSLARVKSIVALVASHANRALDLEAAAAALEHYGRIVASDQQREWNAAQQAGVPFMGSDTLDVLVDAVLYERARADKAVAR